MFSRVEDFITRHRRKFIVTSVLIGGTILVGKYAQRKVLEMQERQAREFLEKTRRMQHFDSTERTCNQVIIGMGAELCQVILGMCSTEELLQQLRRNPADKLDLWEEIKIVTFTRLATFIYASSMLVIALRVQLNLLGGYLFRDITMAQKRISDEVKQQYLSLLNHFLHNGGINELVRLIRNKVVEVIKAIPLTQQLSLVDMEQIFWSLQMAINYDAKDPNTKMSKYLLPSRVPTICETLPLLYQMYNETLDLLENDDTTSVCLNNVCRGFSLAIDAIAENVGDTLQHLSESSDKSNSSFGSNTLNINNLHLALAKLIPIISGLTSHASNNMLQPHNLSTSLVTFYLVAEKNKVLGANVYETFSSS